MSPAIVYCRPEPLDAITRALLFISAIRTRIHVHEADPCEACLSDMLGLGAHAFAMLNLINDQERQIEELTAQLDRLRQVPEIGGADRG